MKKKSLENIVKELPNEFNLDEFLEKLIVIEKIDAGLEDVKNDRTISHAKVKKTVKKWLK